MDLVLDMKMKFKFLLFVLGVFFFFLLFVVGRFVGGVVDFCKKGKFFDWLR